MLHGSLARTQMDRCTHARSLALAHAPRTQSYIRYARTTHALARTHARL